MDTSGFCLNCFSQRGGYEVCPYCGYAAGSIPAEGYVLHPGTRLWGRYIIGTVLGAGGFGITYRVWDTRLNALVAIKEFFPQSLVSRIPGEMNVRVFSGEKQESYAGQLARFIEEAKNMAKFTGSANIVNVLDYFEDNGTAYIVMEYLDGVTLKEYMAMQGGSLPPQQAVHFGTALLKALATIHSKSIIHRDISPDNVFVLPDASIKVLDFGAARFVANEGSDLTQGVVVKKGYAPPEQYRTNMKQGVWTDIYAAGATLYKMITGITPDESIERTEKDMLKRPSQTVKLLDASIDKTLMKAMALRPELRFKSAEAMLAALENRTIIDFPEEELKKRKKRNAMLGVASAVLVAAMAGLVAWRAAQPPQTIISGPAIVEEKIAADTISFLVPLYPNHYSNPTSEFDTATQLADAFMRQYPQHTVVVESYDYIYERLDEIYREMTPRFFTADAPTLFNEYLPDVDQAETPYKADISPVYASLNADDYLFLAEYGAAKAEENDGAIYDVPVGFAADIAYVNKNAAAARGMDVPAAVTSWEELRALELKMPGTVDMWPDNVATVLEDLRPDIVEKKDLNALENIVVDYAQLYNQGYYRTWNNITEEDFYQYDEAMLTIDWTSGDSIRHYRQEGAYQAIPLVANGEIQCKVYSGYSVSCHATENQQKLAMLFLRFMLSENGQNIIHVQNDDRLPLQKTALAQFVQAYPEMSFLTEEYIDKLVFANNSGINLNGLNGLRDLMQNREATEEEIRAYVRQKHADWDG